MKLRLEKDPFMLKYLVVRVGIQPTFETLGG